MDEWTNSCSSPYWRVRKMISALPQNVRVITERDWLFIVHQWEALDSMEGHMITVMKNNA